jgi:DNA-binding LacI/PurR family transcriptional regulator
MTSKEFSKIAGVSQSTVSRALNGAAGVSEEKRQMIMELAQKYGFELNSSAKALKMNRTNRIGISFADNFISFEKSLSVTAMYEKLRDALLRCGYETYPIYGDKEFKINAIRKAVLRKEIDGIIFLSTNDLPPEETLRLLGEKDIPHVGIYAEKYRLSGRCRNISMNYWKATYRIGEYLIKKGHREIAFCSGKYDFASRNKYETFIKMLSDYKIKFDDRRHFSTGYTFQSGYECAVSNIESMRECTAVFSHNDASALGIIAGLNDYGMKVPQDISVVGMGNLQMSCWWRPHLTTIGFDDEAIIKKASEMLIALLNDADPGEDAEFDSYVIERESVKECTK